MKRHHQVGLACGRSRRRGAGGRAFEALAEGPGGLAMFLWMSITESACGCCLAGSPQRGQSLLLSSIGCHISCSSVANCQRIAVAAFGTDVFEAEVLPRCLGRPNSGPNSAGSV